MSLIFKEKIINTIKENDLYKKHVVQDSTKYIIYRDEAIKLLEENKVTFSNCSIDQLNVILGAHYEGSINISNYWNEGDTKDLMLNELEEGWPSQLIRMKIIAFNHDNLSDGSGKAAITIWPDTYIVNSTKCGTDSKKAFHSSDDWSKGWEGSDARQWCNNIFYNAFPNDFKKLIKLVDKESTSGSENPQQINITKDYAFFLSATELFGNNYLYMEDNGRGAWGITEGSYYGSTAWNSTYKYSPFYYTEGIDSNNCYSWLRTYSVGSYSNYWNGNVGTAYINYSYSANLYGRNMCAPTRADIYVYCPAFCL